jgi:hypothetical protein
MAKVKTVIRRKRGHGRGIAGLLFVLVLALYIPAMWKWFFTKGLDSGIIQEDTLEMKISVSGVFIRNEQILTSPNDGTIIPSAQYGERLPSRGVIASFVSSDAQDTVRQYRSARTEVLIRVVEAAKAAGDTEVSVIDDAVEQESGNLALAANEGDIRQMSDIRESINRVLAEQAGNLVSRDAKDGFLANEREELKKLETRMAKTLMPMTTSQPGIVCYSFDGFESLWTAERMASLTVGAIDLQPADKVAQRRWVTPEEIAVKKGEPYGKLVQNDACWIAMEVDEKTLKTLSSRLETGNLEKRETVVPIEVDGIDERIPLQLISVRANPDGKGDGLVIGRMSRFVEQAMEIRKMKGELVLQSLKGMKVPQKSLFNRNSVDGTADIMLLKMNRAALRRVHVLGVQDSWAVIENLDKAGMLDRISVYDLYLQNPDGVMDGQVIQK